jgi:hypothetical protein
MSQELLNLGTVANDRTGDTWRAGGEKINSNFTELYSVTTPLNSKDDVLANGTLLAGIITLTAGCYSLGVVDLGTDVLRVGGGTSITGCTATFSSIVSSSASPTITFIDGGFNASGLTGSAGIQVNNTSTGAAIRVEGNDTLVFLTNIFSDQSGNALELHNIGGVGLMNYTALNLVNGCVITGTTNTGPILDGFNPIGATGKGVDVQGNITNRALRIRNALISSVGNAIDISGTILGLEFTGDSISTGTGNGLKISGTVSNGASLNKTNILAYGNDGVDITGSTMSNLICTSAGMTSLAASKSGLKGDAGSANITAEAILETCNIGGLGSGGSALSGITKKDIRYSFTKAGATITDSRNIGSFTLDAQATTTISIQGNDGTITAYADAGGSITTVTSAGHPLNNTDPVSITGTVEYNGLYNVTSVTANTFDIARAFVTDEATGDWMSGFYKINGATTVGETIERFTGVTSNELISLDTKTIPITYTGIVSGEKSGATANAYQFAIFRDDGVAFKKVNGVIQIDLTNRVSEITVRIPTEASEDDKFTVFVRNIDASNDFICDTLTVDIGLS